MEIEGGRAAKGEVEIQGSKNAVLPMLAASLLCKAPMIYHNCPRIDDVDHMCSLLKESGCQVTRQGHGIMVDSSRLDKTSLEEEKVKKIRASVLFMGSLLGRTGEVQISYPGGCSIGKRPIDYHLKAFEKMGASITEEESVITCQASHLRGARIELPFPSVGATENILLAAVLADGVTWIYNAAREPEITELCKCLRSMGARIEGDGTEHILVRGVESLHGASVSVGHDRIALLTYGFLAAATAGKVVALTGHKVEDDLSVLTRIGCEVRRFREGVEFGGKPGIQPIYYVKTRPYPGFPTDAQPLLSTVLAKATGNSIVEEGVFENRFGFVPDLISMGAKMETKGRKLWIHENDSLHGTRVKARDLRSGAAFMIAGAMAEGKTRIDDTHYILRGYEDIQKNFADLGVVIS